LWPLLWPLGEEPRDQRGERGRRDGTPLGQRRRRLDQMRGEHRLGRAPTERVSPGKRFVRDEAERVQVGAVVGRGIGGRLLGRHVRWRPHGDAERRAGGRPGAV
jgi:hypothetical protein